VSNTNRCSRNIFSNGNPLKFELLWEKLVGFLQDGAHAKVGKDNGVGAKLKSNEMKEFEGTTSLLRRHSILYQEALCAKGLKMMREMDTEINTVNFYPFSVHVVTFNSITNS
jgi:hypothetical protein